MRIKNNISQFDQDIIDSLADHRYIDIRNERKRINADYQNKINRNKLHKLLDLIEEEKWEEAYNELQSKWWKGRDKIAECSRYEFLGPINKNIDCDNWFSFGDLVYEKYKEFFK